MTSLATQDPSAWTYAAQGAGHGLWGTTSTLAAPTLATPGGSGALANGLSAAANNGYSLATPNPASTSAAGYSSVQPTSLTAPTYATSPQQGNAAAAAAASPAPTATATASPSVAKIAAPSRSKIAVNTGAQGGVNTSNTPQQIVALTTYASGRGNTYAQWDANTQQYVPLNAAQNAVYQEKAKAAAAAQAYADYQAGRAPLPSWLQPAPLTGPDGRPFGGGITDQGALLQMTSLADLNKTAASNSAAAAAMQGSLASGSNAANTAIGNTTITAAPTVQNANFDFSSAFNQTPTLNAATATAQQGQNALASQLSTNNYQSGSIAAGGRYGAAQAVNEAGQNQLALQTAAATDENNNLMQFGNALSAQSAAASAYTGAQAQSDISNIQDDISALSTHLSTLDAATQAKVGAHLAALQDQINRYNEAVQQAGADSSIAKKIFAGVLAMGSIVAAAATGGAAAPAAVAATANAAQTIGS